MKLSFACFTFLHFIYMGLPKCVVPGNYTSILPPWKVIGNSKGEGRGRTSLKPNFLKESTKLNWNFQRGGGRGFKPNLPWEECE